MPIRLLSPEVSSKIAAGEVIERPASVVKELVENSLDARSTEISVEIRGGGIELIRVADNGGGIPAGEMELAVQRFATSKVSTADDLEAIATLGFRGEALPSIGVVSSMTIVSRSRDEDFGARLDVVEGEITAKEPQGASPGTSVAVRHLFRNFPARRKFLRTVATEASRIQTLVTRYALAYPEVRFELRTERGVAFSSAGSGDLREVIAAVYGLDVAQAMLELPKDSILQNAPMVSGMIGPVSLDRANRAYMSLFVNRRWVQNRSLAYALEQAYHGFLMEKRYPVAVINLSVPHNEVDVNAHPAKTEVRFRHEGRIFGAVQQAVRDTLMAHSPVPEMRHAHTTHPGPVGTQPSQSVAAPTYRGSATFWPVEPFARQDVQSPQPSGSPASQQASFAPLDTPQAQPPPPRKALPALRVLGQTQSTYIIAEGPDGVYLIDQHAAHERVVFEQVRAKAASGASEIQSLLEPVAVALNPEQQELAESQAEIITAIGFALENFGPQTCLLRGVPRLVTSTDPARALLDVLDTMAEGGGFETWEERAAYSIACHAAIRAGKTLSMQEMMELARQLEECQQPNTCPHGRPTMIHLSASHLEREFGRA